MSEKGHSSGVSDDHLEVQSRLLGHYPRQGAASEELSLKELFPELIANSPVMTDVLRTVCKVAKASSSVLILGESGTGKELIAAAIHRLSTRARHNYVAINCSAIPEDLLEAELFGHEKGAFTGADRKRVGHFGLANHGSVFLDEVGDMPPRLQAKLLRVLQEKRYTPVGSNEVKEVDVRIIAATNVNLEEAVKRSSFRLDLYYRLNVLPITLPPLRQRPGDIPFLLEHFLDHANHDHALARPCWFDPTVIHLLSRFAWPGNVRQLQNLVERLVIMKGGGKITLEELPREFTEDSMGMLNESRFPQEIHSIPAATEERAGAECQLNVSEITEALRMENLPEDGIQLSAVVEQIENFYIREALRKTNNNKNQAARLLGLNRTTLVERIKKRKLSISA